MSDDCCEAIDTRALHREQKRALTLVLGINVTTFLMMVVASIVSGSSTLLSGTLDNFGDAVTYALSFAVVGATVLLILFLGSAARVLGAAWRRLAAPGPQT